jgi:DNA-binding NtrC family response regulator
LKRYAREHDKSVTRIGDGALSLMVGYDWPGNVRELENVIEHAVVLCDGASIEPRHLPAELTPAMQMLGAPRIPGATLDELERYAILKTMEAGGGSTAKAAEVLGISVRKIQYKLHEYGGAPKSKGGRVAVHGHSAHKPKHRARA